VINKDVAIVIPVYNEAKVIKGVIESVMHEYGSVICVNDGSIDSSSEEIRKTKAFLIEHPINMGQGAALQTGIEFALMLKNIKYIVTFDADGQHRIEDVTSMLDVIRSGNVDIVLGSRFLGKSTNMSTLKKGLLKAAVIFTNATSGLTLTDTHNGLRVMTRRTAELLDLKMSDYTHASEIIERISQKNLRFIEIPVTIDYTEYSIAKGQSPLNAINIAFDMLMQRISGR